MDSICLARFVEIVGGCLVDSGASGRWIRNVSINSNHLRSGSAFFAFPGVNTDGHKYVECALKNGAVAAVVEQSRLNELSIGLNPLVVVENSLDALRELAKWWRANLSATTFVAVVGNIGKSVTKDALVHLIGPTRSVYGSPASYNSQLGVPLSVLECPKNTQLAVIEAASTEPGAMLRLAELIRPDHVVLTNFGSRFESNFDDSLDYAREIVKIADGLTESAWLLIGELDPLLSRVVESLQATRYIQGISESLPSFSRAEHQIDRVLLPASFPDGGSGTLVVHNGSDLIATDVKLAISAGWLLGLSSTELITAAQDYSPTSARMEVWRSSSGATVVRDVATTDGTTFTAAVRVAKRFAQRGGKTTVVLMDTYNQCNDDAALVLGKSIGSAGVSALCTLRYPVHGTVVSEAKTANPGLEIRDFASVQDMRRYLTSTLSVDDVVLIESPRQRTISQLSRDLVEPIAPTRLYIDQSSVECNVLAFRRLIGSDIRLMAMVKALAYGTSPVQLSVCLEAAGVDALGVATVDEGVALRRAGISLPILVTLPTESDMDRIAAGGLTPLVYSSDMLDAVLRHCESDGLPLEIHLEVDSGMHRTGFGPQDAIAALRKLSGRSTIRLAGLMTHFACAETATMDDFTLRQISKFEEVVGIAEDLGYDNIIRHAANTAGTVRFPTARLDMVRIGIGLFGIYPSPETMSGVKLNPAVGLRSEIVKVISLDVGDTVGYGATFRASERVLIGLVPAGYHDCVPRSFANVGAVSVNGHLCPIIGNVSMDSMTIDITRCPGATVGSEVVIYGSDTVRIEDAASQIGTIPYELLVRVGPRVQRVLTRH